MIKKRRVATVISMLPALLAGWHAQAQEITDNLEVSGFARVIGGYLDHDDRRFEGYTDEVSFGEQSLVAVQPTYSFNDKLSVTSQLIGYTNSDRDSGVEWAYLSYQPNSAWHLRAGKLRTPFFIYSDSIDVGYSYPWVTAPIQIYDNYMFSTFNGASASYYQSGSEVALNLEAYYGYFKGDLFFEGSKVDLETEVEDLAGIVATINRNNLSLRMAYHQGQNKTEIPYVNELRTQLYAAGFNASAESLESSGDVYALQTSLSYDTLNSFYKAEWVKAVTGFEIAPEVTAYYLMAGYVHNDLTFHLTYSRSEYKDVEAEDELPTSPTGNPQFDLLSAAYYRVFENTANGSLSSYTLGTRWDFRLNMALKADVSMFEASEQRNGLPPGSDTSTAEDAYLYQVAWEWIF